LRNFFANMWRVRARIPNEWGMFNYYELKLNGTLDFEQKMNESVGIDVDGGAREDGVVVDFVGNRFIGDIQRYSEVQNSRRA